MTPEIRETLNNAYRVFAPYWDEYEMARVCGINRPLHALTFEDWSEMSDRFDIGVLLWSDISFRHFLPMLMEWELRNDMDRDKDSFRFWSADVFYRLKRFNWLQWPLEEVEAIRRVLRLWVREALANPQKRPLILLEVEGIEDELNPYFNLWLEKRPLEVARWLMEQDWAHPESSLLRWATQLSVEKKLEAAFWNNPESEQGALFSRTIQLLSPLRSHPN